MRLEFDLTACEGWFKCIPESELFEIDNLNGKATVNGASETSEGVFEREIPAEMEEEVQAAARSCPVNAITVYDESGDQLSP